MTFFFFLIQDDARSSLRCPSGWRLSPFTLSPRSRTTSPVQISSPLGHFALSPWCRSLPSGGPARDPRVPFASPSARQPGSPHRPLLLRLAAAAHPPAPSSPEPGLPSPPFALSQSPARPRAPAARSPADSPVLIQSGLAMLAMAKIKKKKTTLETQAAAGLRPRRLLCSGRGGAGGMNQHACNCSPGGRDCSCTPCPHKPPPMSPPGCREWRVPG